MPTIKHPPGYDISRYETVNDFNLIEPNPFLIITKATEGLTYIDPTFETYFGGIKSSNIRRGAYHFHRKAYNPIDQANHFYDTCFSTGLDNNDILVLDVEEGGETADQLEQFTKQLQAHCDNKIIIYSRKNLLDPIEMTQEQRDFFIEIPIWTAGYPYNPDAYDSPPAHYIPDQSKWGAVWMWQYSDQGIVKGIDGKVDLNWLSPAIIDWLGVPPETTKSYFYDIAPENVVRAEVTGYPTFRTVEQVAQEFHATVQPGNHSIVVNGDGWGTHTLRVWAEKLMPLIRPVLVRATYPNGDWVVDGIWKHIQPRDTYHPRITFDSQQKGAIAEARGAGWYPNQLIDHNAFGLTRRLVVNSVINPAFQETGELNSRIGFGFTPDGHLIICAKDGWDYYKPDNGKTPPAGWTLTKLGLELISRGVVMGGDGDGGGSMTIAVDGQVINGYNNDGEKIMRNVFNCVMLEVAELDGLPEPPIEPPPNGGEMIPGEAQEKLGKTMTVRDQPGAVSGSDIGERIYPDKKFDWYAIVDDVNYPNDQNYQWFVIAIDADGNPTKYTNYIYPPNGERATILSEPQDPTEPPPTEGRKIADAIINYDDGSSERLIPE